MADIYTSSPTIIRTERGLSFSGTRITLYDIMDYLKADWPPQLIGQWLALTEQHVADALLYIDEHRDEVEAEYQLILQQAASNRHYWETHNHKRLEEIANLPPKPGFEVAYAKLQARKAERNR